MNRDILILSAAQIAIVLYQRWVIGNLSKEEWNVAPIFRNPRTVQVLGGLAVISRIVFVGIVVLAFFVTIHPWWFLGGSIALAVLLGPSPRTWLT